MSCSAPVHNETNHQHCSFGIWNQVTAHVTLMGPSHGKVGARRITMTGRSFAGVRHLVRQFTRYLRLGSGSLKDRTLDGHPPTYGDWVVDVFGVDYVAEGARTIPSGLGCCRRLQICIYLVSRKFAGSRPHSGLN